ncbi:MAG: hypothetical protein ACREMW_12655, partial [Gemmatimonadales bacterium]
MRSCEVDVAIQARAGRWIQQHHLPRAARIDDDLWNVGLRPDPAGGQVAEGFVVEDLAVGRVKGASLAWRGADHQLHRERLRAPGCALRNDGHASVVRPGWQPLADDGHR